MNRIAQYLSSVAGERQYPVFLYMEYAEGCYGGSLFKDEGNRLVDEAVDSDLATALYEDWLDFPETSNGVSCGFFYRPNGQFTVSFSYPNEIDVSNLDMDSKRRTAAVRAIFGDKPTYYPPIWPAFELNNARYAGFDGPLG